MDFKELKDQPRLLMQADLQLLQGSRFQPTGFPDLGAATYNLPGEKQQKMLLVESAQSVANRLESMIWDEAGQTVIPALQGISYVTVQQPKGGLLTNSLLEAHRLNSPYIVGSSKKLSKFGETLKKELQVEGGKPFDLHQFATVLVKYDVNSLLHGIFLEKMSGVSRIARALSGFIEAKNVEVVRLGGVKNDRVDATGKTDEKGGSKEGYGNVPYYREEYAAESITAYFSLDLAQIRSYRLGEAIEDLLIAIALYKIQAFLDRGLRLRTACDLEVKKEITVKRPDGYKVPSLPELETALPQLVKAASSMFANPAVQVVEWQPETKTKKTDGGQEG
ncbi:type I-U CRISPR-associated RAMP protein Csb1/Cas7u [Alkalinema pantanalense CENA528]|uniref:type I-G CRISPR-associated RAMP protein Csb1/Cas7g n=1 Tax=Alkalinema pantanalense TaxID=1620705 RepID=UPI003D6E2270